MDKLEADTSSRSNQEDMHMRSTTIHLYRWIFILGCFVLGGFHSDAFAANSPTQAIKETTDALLAVLEDPQFSPVEKAAERRARLQDILATRFDYAAMAQRTLARHWKKRSVEERHEFTSLFSKLLVNSYITIIESRTDEQVHYLDETIRNDFARVKTDIVAKSGTVAVEYRMRQKNGEWRVYEVVIAGVSLVGNFRKQFERIIRLESFGTLTRRRV